MTTRLTLDQFIGVVGGLPDKLEKAGIRAMRSSAMRLQGVVVEEIEATSPHPPVDTGELRQSVSYDRLPDGAAVSVDAPHAPFMEHGTRPHTPPLGPLLEWASRKGFEDPAAVARAVQRKIAARGIEPRHFFSRSMQRARAIIFEEIRREFRGALGR